MTSQANDRQALEQRLIDCLASPAALAITHSGLPETVAQLADELGAASRQRGPLPLGALDVLLGEWDQRLAQLGLLEALDSQPLREQLTAIAAVALAVSDLAASVASDGEQRVDGLDVLLRASAIACDPAGAAELPHGPGQILQRDRDGAGRLREVLAANTATSSATTSVWPELQALATTAAATAVVIAVGRPVDAR